MKVRRRAAEFYRKLVEHPFGWPKSVAGRWQVKHCGRAKVEWTVTFAMAVYNLGRMRNLLAVTSRKSDSGRSRPPQGPRLRSQRGRAQGEVENQETSAGYEVFGSDETTGGRPIC
jgi:hypothetical protein